MNKVAIIRKESFVIAKSKKKVENSFAVINDGKEITIVMEQESASSEKFIEFQKDYKLITFNMTLPFEMVGFISNISQSLAREKIPIFVISAYSTDHLLVKNKYSEKAVEALETLGFEVKSL